VAAGEAKLPVERLAGIRDEARRTSEFIVVPARGLTLLEVGYPDVAELAERAIQTRARRSGLDNDPPID
jgi:tRNA pseudouridine38-40 synthase